MAIDTTTLQRDAVIGTLFNAYKRASECARAARNATKRLVELGVDPTSYHAEIAAQVSEQFGSLVDFGAGSAPAIEKKKK